MTDQMTFHEAITEAWQAWAAVPSQDDAATNFVAVVTAWWIDTTGGTPADLFLGESEGDGIPVPSGLGACPLEYWEQRAGKCFKCSFPIETGHALCPACTREARADGEIWRAGVDARARDWEDDRNAQSHPAMA